MPDIPSSQRKRRRELLAKALVENGYDWVVAGTSVGYSLTYCKTCLRSTCMKDTNFTKLLERYIKESRAETQDEREKTAQFLAKTRDDETVSSRDRVAAAKVLGQMSGWMSQTVRLETPERQRQLDAAASEMAEKAAKVVHETRMLPDGSYAPLPMIQRRHEDMPAPEAITAESAETEPEQADSA